MGEVVQDDKILHDTREEASLLHPLQRAWYQSLCVLRRPGVQVVALSIIIFVAALGLNLYRLGIPSLWFDEVLSVTRARQPLSVLLQIISNTQPNMALYYVILHYWLNFTAAFGLHPTEFVVRFPSAIFAALSSVMVFLLGRRFLSIPAGLTAMALYLLNDLQLVYAQQTRSYSLQLLFICISWYAIFAIVTIESHQRRWWACFTVVSALAIYTHLFSLFILFTQILALGVLLILPGPWRSKMRGQLPTLIVSIVGIAVLTLPILIASRVGAKTGWLPIPNFKDIFGLFLTISDGSTIYLLLIALCVLLGLSAVVPTNMPWGQRVLDRLSVSASSGEKRLGVLPVAVSLVLWVLVPVAASYIVSQKSTHLFSSRYLVVIVPAFFLLVGLGVTVVRWRLVQVLLGLCLVLIGLHHVPFYYQHAQVEDWKTAANWLQQNFQAHDGLVCYDNSQGCQVSITYYLTAYPDDGDADFNNDSPGAFNWVDYDITNKLGNFTAAVDPKALEAYGAKHSRIFFAAGRTAPGDVQAKAAQLWLDTHYTFIGQVVTQTVTIRLYATRT
jgi:4-amino-4-deoxy-L-arabinose transferase-like glycosyltransferase